MNVKLRVLTIGVLFFTGQTLLAQNVKKDTTTDKAIEEVVVLGYSKVTTKPKDVTASTTVSAEVLENRPNVSFLNSIQGTAPGVAISSMSGSPGSAKIDVMIRGLSSLNASTDPLYVIDGISYSATEFRNINVNDIESLSILRDAAATSIYGSRGANGVIVISTKKGKFNSDLKVGYTGITGVAVLPQNKYNLAGRDQILRLQKNYNQGGLGVTTPEDQWSTLPDTNWKETFFKPTITQQHDVNMTSGGQNLSSYTSIGYMEQGGIVPTTDFRRFTLRNNLNGKSSNGKFTYNTQLAVGYSKRNQLNEETNDAISNNVVQNPLHGSLLALPYLQANQYPTGQSLYNAIGTGFAGGRYIYVLEDILREGNYPSEFSQTSILANIQTTYKLTPYLTLSNKAGVDYKRNDRVFARAPWAYLSLAVALPANLAFPGFEDISTEQDFTFNNVFSLNFHKDLGDHTLDVGAYFDYLKAHNIYTTRRQNGLDPLTYSPGTSNGYVPIQVLLSSNPLLPSAVNYVPQIGGWKINAGTLSYFGTLDYDYASKYGFNGVIRRDASYRFAEGNKWATFWSVAGRWNIDQESFLQDTTFNMLKLRASYGTQGNQNLIVPIAGQNPLFLGGQRVRDLNLTGNSYNNGYGIRLNQLGNPDISWEEVRQANIGVDFQILDRKIEGNIDVYEKITNNLFNDTNLSGASTGQYAINGNNGKMSNRGIELMLRYNILNKPDFKLSVFANGAYNENKVKEINGGFQQYGSYVHANGSPAYEWYLVPYVGVNPNTGEMQFLAADGSITETPTEIDRRQTNKSFFPKFQGGFGVNLDIKGFFLDTLFSWQKDSWKFDNQFTWLLDPTSIAEYNVSADLLNAWTPTNTNTDIPSLTAANTGLDGISDRYLYDASFLKLRSLTLGYNVPKSLIGEGFIKSMKVFVQGENLVIWTKWRGYDPEGFSLFPLGRYPNPRTISLGTNIEF